jgi:raffinose synthase
MELQVLFLLFYQSIVDPAGPNSWPVVFFRFLANGPMKGPLLSFFKSSGDFTKRLISVKANGKFSRPDADSSQRAWFAEPEDFRGVIDGFRRNFGVRYVYCWHGLPAYWGGIMPTGSDFQDLGGRIVFPKPTAGLREIEPAMLWNPAVVAGIGMVDDPQTLYYRMHKYLAESGVDGVKVCLASLI